MPELQDTRKQDQGRDAIIVRIDNILCSPALRPYRCRIDRSIVTSDHYPMTAYIAPAKE